MSVTSSVVNQFESVGTTMRGTSAPNHTLVLSGVDIVSTMSGIIGSKPFKLFDVLSSLFVVFKLSNVFGVVVVNKVFRELLVEKSEGFVQNPS